MTRIHRAAKHHLSAADHHDAAARHHREAARLHQGGDHDHAAREGEVAGARAQVALDFATEAGNVHRAQQGRESGAVKPPSGGRWRGARPDAPARLTAAPRT